MALVMDKLPNFCPNVFFISFEKDIDMSVVSCDETSVGFRLKRLTKSRAASQEEVQI